MSTNLPVVVPDREPLTEDEARRIGDAAYRLGKLRQMATIEGPFDLTSPGKPGPYGAGSGTHSYRLYGHDGEAVLALLIERETLFLASFNVKVQ